MGRLSLIRCNQEGIALPTTSGPIYALRGRVVLTELDQWDVHDIQISGDARKEVQAMTAFSTIKLYEEGVGFVGWGIIHDPAQQITYGGTTINLQLHNITDQLAQYSTGIGASYQTALGSIVGQLGDTGPSGETVTLWNTTLLPGDTSPVVAGYVGYSGNVLFVYNPTGGIVTSVPGPAAASTPLYDKFGGVRGYVSTDGVTTATIFDQLGAPLQTFAPTGEVSGWSATMLDDGSHFKTSAPIDWTDASGGKVTIAGSTVRKLPTPATDPATAPDTAYDGAAVSVQTVNALFDGSGNPLPADATMSWIAPNITSQYVAGLALPSGGTPFYVQFGFFITPGDPTVGVTPTATWMVWEAAGATPASGPYHSGSTFRVSFDYVGTTPVAHYYVDERLVYTSGNTPVLPLQPLVVHAAPGGALESGVIQRTTTASQAWWSVVFEQETPLSALTTLAKTSYNHVRMGANSDPRSRDYLGPARTIEFGPFGVVSDLRLMSAEGADATAMAANAHVRVITQLNYKIESSKAINTITPLGASTGDSQVDLERAWQIVNDRANPYYGKVGDVPGTIFADYDPVRFPIMRRLSRARGWEYYVRDLDAYRAAGQLAGKAAGVGMEVRGRYTDPQFTYVDQTVAAQELTAITLYVATVAKLKWEGQIHHTLDLETVGAFRPPAAGSRVNLDFRKIGSDVAGNFRVMDTRAVAALKQPWVTKVERGYDGEGKTTDKWTLSSIGRQPEDANSAATASSLRDLEAIKMTSQQTTAFLPISGEGDIDAALVDPNTGAAADHALVVDVDLPVELFRVRRAPINVQLSAARHNFAIADAIMDTQGGTVNLTGAINSQSAATTGQSIDPITLAAKNFTGPAYTTDASARKITTPDQNPATTLTAAVAADTKDGGFATNLYVHIYGVNATGTTTGTGFYPESGGKAAFGRGSGSSLNIPVYRDTNAAQSGLDSAATAHQHGYTNGGTAYAHSHNTDHANEFFHKHDMTHTHLFPHVHALKPGLVDTATPKLVYLFIDSGDGQWKDVSSLLVDVNTRKVGPWTASFAIEDASAYVNSPGKKVRLRVVSKLPLSGDDGFVGLGHARVTGTWLVEIGGNSSTLFKN